MFFVSFALFGNPYISLSVASLLKKGKTTGYCGVLPHDGCPMVGTGGGRDGVIVGFRLFEGLLAYFKASSKGCLSFKLSCFTRTYKGCYPFFKAVLRYMFFAFLHGFQRDPYCRGLSSPSWNHYFAPSKTLS